MSGTAAPLGSPLDEEHLDGHTITELSDYLDNGRIPFSLSIESSPGAQNALAALSRLRAIAPKILEAEARSAPPRNDGWIRRVLEQIGVQAQAGRDIPISHSDQSARLSISEGAVRALVREVGDDLDGLVVERCRLEGDVESVDAPVTVTVRVSVFVGADAESLTARLRASILNIVRLHTQLNIVDVVVQVRDQHLPAESE